MSDKQLSEEVIQSISACFFAVVNDMFEVEIEARNSQFHCKEKFSPKDQVVAHIDYIGSVVGLVAISASENFFGKCFDMPEFEESGLSREQYMNELAGPLKECMNTVAGKCLPILAGKISCVSMLAPKVIFGNLSYPKTPCMEKITDTNLGSISTHFLLDRMKLDTSRAIDRYQASEKSTKSVISSMGLLYKNLETTQRHVLSEVGNTIKQIADLQELVEGRNNPQETSTRDVTSALTTLRQTKDLMDKRLSDIVHDLNMFKGMLLNNLRVTKVRESNTLREVNLCGFLSDESNLDFFLDQNRGQLIINVNGLYNHTQEGINLWIASIRKCHAELKIYFVNCSSPFLSLAEDNSHILGSGTIKSVSAHYFCQACEFKEEFELHLDQLDKEMDIPKVECNCGHNMILWEGCDQQGLIGYLNTLNSPRSS